MKIVYYIISKMFSYQKKLCIYYLLGKIDYFFLSWFKQNAERRVHPENSVNVLSSYPLISLDLLFICLITIEDHRLRLRGHKTVSKMFNFFFFISFST